jgi:hypothetical protein
MVAPPDPLRSGQFDFAQSLGQDHQRSHGFEFKKWSKTRDLDPGPHGPEPSWLHVLECPADSAGAHMISTAVAFVSSHDLIGPSGAGNA